jgi:hypothetical protein
MWWLEKIVWEASFGKVTMKKSNNVTNNNLEIEIYIDEDIED